MCEQTYGWNLEMQVRAAQAGLRILEVPVDHRRRAGGESKVSGNWKGSILAGSSIVLTLAGDGDFLMNGQDFATAVQFGIPLVVAIIDNGMYGTIRMHQERHYPGRVSATALKNPDFAALGRAYGGFGATVRTAAEFKAAFEEALASGKPAILHCLMDGQAITPTATIDGIRAAALKG